MSDSNMIQINKIANIKSEISVAKKSGKKIALVATMGALHEGHLALIKTARQLADIVVVSIFVNKTQFNDENDYQKYPRQLNQDLDLLKNHQVDFVFTPDDSEIYPPDFSFEIIVKNYADCLCGLKREGHFDGVALIVLKLFNIITPDIAIFGQKDYQQLLIIKKLVLDFNLDIKIIEHEILREKSGLAMSSRNQRLDEDAKIKAAMIYQILQEIKTEIQQQKNINEILQKKRIKLLENNFEKIDYLEIRNEKNLQLVNNFLQTETMRIFVAVYLNGVRLIDNLKI